MFTGHQPEYSKVHEFGIPCFSYVRNKSKLDKRAEEGIYVGQDPLSPATLVYLSRKNSIVRSRDVKFLKYNPVIPTVGEEEEPAVSI